MADPAPYEPGYDYTAFTAGLGDGSFPGPALDVDLANIATSIEELVNSVKDVRRSDGAIQNASVSYDSLGPTARYWILGVASGEATSEALVARDEAVAARDISVAAADDAEEAITTVAASATAAGVSATAAAAAATAAVASAADAASEVVTAIAALDPWQVVPIGVLVAMPDNITGITAPPTDQAYRYIRLTAGQTGSGQYNEGVLTSESVSGSAPEVTATAVVSLSGSPINGQAVRLINSERRFLRAGSAGTLEDSANKSHNHGGAVAAAGSHFHTYTRLNAVGTAQGGSGAIIVGTTTDNTSTAPDHDHNISSDGGTEARPRNVGVTYYLRIK